MSALHRSSEQINVHDVDNSSVVGKSQVDKISSLAISKWPQIVVHRMQREIIHSLSSNKFLFAKKKSFTHDRNMNVFVVVPLFDNEESSFHGSAM